MRLKMQNAKEVRAMTSPLDEDYAGMVLVDWEPQEEGRLG